ncbi:MAG: hypothetical protein PF495_18720, partial [Spirochaetales bacterium]|nr:hypothetical protein [Spirochaetales bacterium]
MMHILILPSWYPTQPDDVHGCFFRDQARSLKEFGHDVGVVAVHLRSLRTVGKATPSLRPFEDDDGVMTYRDTVWAALPRIPYGNYWLWRRKARLLFNHYVRERGLPDIIHAHSALFGGAVAAELGSS